MKAYLLRIDGSGELVDLPDRTYGTLRGMYDLIGCTAVDVVRVSPTLDMWVDDEGMYTKEENLFAALVVMRYWGTLHQGYYGTTIFTGGADANGDTVALDDQEFVDLVSQWNHA